jgi:hypothetical protein
MSAVSIRAALEVALNAMSPALATSWENQKFTPPAVSVPYQIATMLFARPDNSVYGSEHQELGYLQVKLMYPQQSGTATVAARAELLRSTFYRGSSFTSSGVVVIISDTPEIVPGQIEDGRYAQVVKIRFYSNIT